MRPAPAKGFTLVELLITLVILGFLIALALPSFTNSLRSNRVATTSNEVLASLSLARSEAIKGIGTAGVCPSTDGTSCTSAATDWSGGWLVWRQERTATGVVTVGVRYVQAKTKMSVTGPAGGVEFTTQGRSKNGVGSIGLAPSDGGTDYSRCVRVSASGQARVVKAACA